MNRRILLLGIVFAVLSSSFAVDAKLRRESGYLTDTTYRNPYYELGLTLPPAHTVSRRTVGPQPKGVHALLALKFDQTMDDGALTIFATDASSGLPLDPKQAAKAQAKECEKQGMSIRRGPYQEVNTSRGHQNLPLFTKTWILEEFNTPTGEFMVYQFFQRKGDLITVVGAMRTKRSQGATTDRALSTRAGRTEVNMSSGDAQTQSLERTRHLGNEGALPFWILPEYFDSKDPVETNYEGPELASAIAPAPLSRPLPQDGKLAGAVFSSAELGLHYGLPQSWNSTDKDVFAQYHPAPADAEGRATHDLLQACSRPMFQAASAAGATLTILAADPACMRVTTPKMSDFEQVQQTASALAQFSDFGKVAGAGILKDFGTSFIQLRGTLPDGRSQFAFITPRDGRLLMFVFTATDPSHIEAFPNSGLRFDAAKE